MRTSLVITSIGSSDLPAFVELQAGCHQHGWDLVVVGDAKSPPDFELSYGRFLPRSAHSGLGWMIGESIPDGNYSLKNIGYLECIAAGAEAIVETDDDNLPFPAFWDPRQESVLCQPVQGSGWVNVYRSFTGVIVWPRGLPLAEVRVEADLQGLTSVCCPVQQGLADGNPDVDAIYRLVGELPVLFDKRPAVSLYKAWSPFNSQNTTWFPRAYPLLYLPTTCSFRMTDIWRSFIALAWLQHAGFSLAVSESTVYQVRNEHDLLRDFAQEVDGYLGNDRLMSIANQCAAQVPADSRDSEFAYLELAYGRLVREGFFAIEEMALVRAWCADFTKALAISNGT